ncbi:hypothetical protein STEG23_034224, partial [Scotinomys teguina]
MSSERETKPNTFTSVCRSQSGSYGIPTLLVGTKRILNRRIPNGQKTFMELLNILSYQGNSNQNDSEIPSYTCQNGGHQQISLSNLRTKNRRPKFDFGHTCFYRHCNFVTVIPCEKTGVINPCPAYLVTPGYSLAFPYQTVYFECELLRYTLKHAAQLAPGNLIGVGKEERKDKQ